VTPSLTHYAHYAALVSDIPSASIYAIYIYNYLEILSDILSGILPGIYSDLLSGVLSRIYSDILSAIYSFFLAYSGIHSDIYFDIPSDMATEIWLSPTELWRSQLRSGSAPEIWSSLLGEGGRKEGRKEGSNSDKI